MPRWFRGWLWRVSGAQARLDEQARQIEYMNAVFREHMLAPAYPPRSLADLERRVRAIVPVAVEVRLEVHDPGVIEVLLRRAA